MLNTIQRRRRLIIRVIALAVAAMVIVGLFYHFAKTRPCGASESRLSEAWNADVQQSIAQTFVATRLPYAEGGWRGVVDRLSRHGDAWTSMHRDACEATLVREEQSPQLMELRMACLDERRTEFVGLAEAFATADARLVERAVDVTGELRGLARCADRDQLLAAYPLPQDGPPRRALEALRHELAVARVRLAAGGLEQVRDVVDGYLTAARDHDFPPLEAEALLLKGNVELQSGRRTAAAETLDAAAAAAVRASDNELVARVWITLSNLLVDKQGDATAAMNALQRTQSYIAQLPAGHPLEARFYGARARALRLADRHELVVKNLGVAVDISRAADHPALASYLNRLSAALGALNRLDEAQAVAAEAMAEAELAFGRHHPNYAAALVGAASPDSIRKGEQSKMYSLGFTKVSTRPSRIGIFSFNKFVCDVLSLDPDSFTEIKSMPTSVTSLFVKYKAPSPERFT